MWVTRRLMLGREVTDALLDISDGQIVVAQGGGPPSPRMQSTLEWPRGATASRPGSVVSKSVEHSVPDRLERRDPWVHTEG